MKFFDLSKYYNDLNLEKLKKVFPDLEERIERLSKIQRHTYKNKKIAGLSLIHSSSLVYWPKDKTGIFSNEKLEYLGDALINFFIAGYSISLIPSFTEGDLSKLRSVIVNSENLAQKSRLLNIGSCLMFGKTENLVSYSNQDNILADAFEAITAALFLDAGPIFTTQWLKKIFHDEILEISKNLSHLDVKGALQQWAQNSFGCLPVYHAVEVSDDAQRPMFEVSLMIDGREVLRASAKSKKLASKKVAEQALKLIEQGELCFARVSDE